MSCARLTKRNLCHPKRYRIIRVPMTIPCTRWIGITTSVLVKRPRRRRKPRAVRSSRKAQQAQYSADELYIGSERRERAALLFEHGLPQVGVPDLEIDETVGVLQHAAKHRENR